MTACRLSLYKWIVGIQVRTETGMTWKSKNRSHWGQSHALFKGIVHKTMLITSFTSPCVVFNLWVSFWTQKMVFWRILAPLNFHNRKGKLTMEANKCQKPAFFRISFKKFKQVLDNWRVSKWQIFFQNHSFTLDCLGQRLTFFLAYVLHDSFGALKIRTFEEEFQVHGFENDTAKCALLLYSLHA